MFLSFPVYFSEDEIEARGEHQLGESQEEAIIRINIGMICTYNETCSGMVLVRMANGDYWEIPLKIRDFESLLSKAESVIELTRVKEN